MSWDRTGPVQYDVIRGYLEGLVSCSACYRLLGWGEGGGGGGDGQ